MEITNICPTCNKEMLRLNNGSFYCATCNQNIVSQTYCLKQSVYIKQDPKIDDDGIWLPYEEYAPEGFSSNYRLLMSKDMFVEAYNKWIKGE